MAHGEPDQGHYSGDWRRYTSGLEKSLAAVNNSIKKTQSQLRDVNNLLKLDPSNTILLAQKQELLQSAIGDSIDLYSQKTQSLFLAWQNGEATQRSR